MSWIGIPSSSDVSFTLSGSSSYRALDPPVPRTRENPPFAAFAPDLSVRLICPDCRDPNPTIIEEFGAEDLVCGSCGLVLGDRVIDTQSEWRTFANDEGDDPSRVGAAADPLMEGIEQLDTIIACGNALPKFVLRVEPPLRFPRHLNQFSLPKTISDIAKQLYRQVDEEKLLRGKPLDAVIAACIFVASSASALEQVFNLAPGSSAARSGATGVTGPEDLLVRYCNHLDLPPHVQAICKDIIVAAREHGIADGSSPVSIAGGAIYFACLLLGVSKAVKDISMVAGVSEGTIKLRLYYTDRQKLVKTEWIADGKVNMDRLPVETTK
ncbi:transcription initiation factor IIB [Lactarius sanguifluus]|nr:transcription initiation factor IIB [Lactarius sanguifluus]